MWDPDTAMGTVTHQEIGYLLPMGPYYALLHGLGVPTWVAQRLWTGSLLFLAGAGVLFLLRTLWAPGSRRPTAAGRGGCPALRPGGRPARGCPRGRPRLHALALRVAVRGSRVGDPVAVGGPALDGGHRGPGARPRRLAPPGGVRTGGGRDRGNERHRTRLRGRGTTAVGGVGTAGPPRALAPGTRHRREDRRARRGRVAVVGGGPGRGGHLRHGRAALHRVHPHRGAHHLGGGDVAGARVLVLLRRGQARPLPAHGRRLHDLAVAHRRQLRRPRLGLLVGLRRALARPRRLRGPGRRGHGAGGGGLPAVEPVAARPGHQGGRHGVDARPGAAQHQPRHPARDPRHGRAPRRGAERAAGALEARGDRRGAGRRRTGGRRHPGRCGRGQFVASQP